MHSIFFLKYSLKWFQAIFKPQIKTIKCKILKYHHLTQKHFPYKKRQKYTSCPRDHSSEKILEYFLYFGEKI